jgi:hypothetical protein
MCLALRAHCVRANRLSCRFVESSPFDHSGTSPQVGCEFYAFCATGETGEFLRQVEILFGDSKTKVASKSDY